MLDAEDINAKGYDRNKLRRNIGVVFQYPEYQLFETTVEKDVAFGLKHSGLSRREVISRVHWALSVMGFQPDLIGKQSPLSLSGGEKRRVAIAGVLAIKPKILIFDEPMAGLDPLGRESFLSLISELNQTGTTIVMVSHNADALCECTKQIFVLDKGKMVMQGHTRDVFMQLANGKTYNAGLSTAQEIAALLSERGVDVPEGIITYDALLSALKSALGGDCI